MPGQAEVVMRQRGAALIPERGATLRSVIREGS
jgi:hypothetical protein